MHEFIITPLAMALRDELNLSRSLEERSGWRGTVSGVPGIEGGVQAQDHDQALDSGFAAEMCWAALLWAS